MNEETFKPTLSKPTVQGVNFQNNAKKIDTQAGLKLNETDGLLSEAEQSLKKKIFSLSKMEALVFSDPKLSAKYEEMAENGEEKYGYHYNETIQNMLFNDYVLNSPKYLQKYKQAIPKEKTRRDQSGINQLKKAGEKTMQHKNDIQKPEKLAPTGLKPAVVESDEPLTKVEFLVNERDPKNPDLFAYFPEENYDNDGKFKTAYSHVGQHSCASPEYAKESRPATPEEYQGLKTELESLGYNLEVVNSMAESTGAGSSGAFSAPLGMVKRKIYEKTGTMENKKEKLAEFTMVGGVPQQNVDTEAEDEPQDDDCYIESNGSEFRVSCGGKNINKFQEMEDALAAVRTWKTSNKWYPNTWFISDHGNFNLIDDKGNILNETTGTGGGSGAVGGAGASGNGETGTGAYYTPSAWGKGELIHPKGEAPVKRIPAWKGGKIIQESNYLIETDGFKKYIQALNEDEDINNKLGQVYQATHSKSNKGLGVSELPQSPERDGKIREIEDNTMLFLGQDLQHSPDGDVEIFHQDMTQPHTLIPHPDNKIPQMQTDGIVQSIPRTPVGVWDKIKAGNGKQTPEITDIEKKSDDGYGDLGNMPTTDLNIINTDINTEKLDNPNLRQMEESKEIKEVAKSKSQQQLFGMAHAVQKGELSPSKVGGAVKKIAKDVSPEDVEDFASTKHKGLPEKVKKVDETEESIIGDKQNSMSNKSVPTNTVGGNVPMGTQNTGGGAMNESDIKLLEELDNELKAYSIHHKKLMKMSEDKKPSSLILKDRLGDENKANFKKDLQHSGTKEIIDVEKELQWKDQQTEVGKDPQKLGAEIEDTEIKATDAKGDEALKNVGNSANEKGDEIPKRNMTEEEAEEVKKYKLNLKDYVYDNEPGKKFEDRMKADMGDENYKQRQTNLEFRGKAPMYNKDPQPTEGTTADKVQFDKEQSGWNERVGLKESMVTGRYLDALGKSHIMDFRLNETKLVSADTKFVEPLFQLDFTGFGNKYENKSQDKKVVIKESVESILSECKYYTNGKDIFAVKNPVQNLNENEQVGKKSPINEQIEKMKHLTGYNTKNYIDTKGIKL